MQSTFRFAPSFCRVVSGIALTSAMLLSGCAAITDPASGTAPVTFGSLSGVVHGGLQPVIGAKLTLYATNNTGYGVGQQLGNTELTGANGAFSFNDQTISCPAGQQAYITAQGGSTGAGTNPNNLLMAALGPCTGINQNTVITVNEVTTVAAAYALSGFITVTGNTTSGFAVGVGAPAHNSASTGTTTSAAGLVHAFLNAANLAPSINGIANTTITNNSPTMLNAIVPQAEINSIADTLQACVNSTGGSANGALAGTSFSPPTTPGTSTASTTYIDFPPVSGTAMINGTVSITYASGTATNSTITSAANATAFLAQLTLPTGVTGAVSGNVVTLTGGTGTANTISLTGTNLAEASSGTTVSSTVCGRLFAYTAPSDTAVPTNTLQAAINLAKNPYANSNVGSLFALGTASPQFTPNLSTAPYDFDLAITYKLLSYPTNCYNSTLATPTACTQASYPYHLTLDANDNVYVTNPAGSSDSTGVIGVNLYGIQSNGALLYVNNGSFPPGAAATDTIATGMRNIAADTLGNLWVADNALSVYELVASTGSPNSAGGGTATGVFTAPNGSIISVAVDASNNVWLGSAKTTASNVQEIAYSSSTGKWSTPVAIGTTTNGAYGLAIDENQNLWLGGEYSAGTTFALLPSTATSFSYTTLPSTSGTTPYGIAIDSAGNGWGTTSGGTQSVIKMTPTGTGTSTALPSSPTATYNAGVTTTASSLRYDTVDGSTNIWVADNGAKGIDEFSSATGLFLSEPGGYQPCLVVSGACAAEGSAGAISGVRNVAVDSTGSIWSPSSTYGTVVQIIGTGTPTWPLLAGGKPGTMPQ